MAKKTYADLVVGVKVCDLPDLDFRTQVTFWQNTTSQEDTESDPDGWRNVTVDMILDYFYDETTQALDRHFAGDDPSDDDLIGITCGQAFFPYNVEQMSGVLLSDSCGLSTTLTDPCAIIAYVQTKFVHLLGMDVQPKIHVVLWERDEEEMGA